MGNVPSRQKRISDGADVPGRPSKRPKIRDGSSPPSAAGSSDGGVVEGGNATSLPPEVWALVMDCLDYRSVLSCAATSRSILRDAMPMVTKLHIFKSRELNATLASRYRDVRDVNVYSMLEGDDWDVVNRDSVMRLVPFLSQFPALERVFLGGRKSNGEVVMFNTRSMLALQSDEAKILIDLISGSYRCCEGLAKDVSFFGLRCPSHIRSDEDDPEPEHVSSCSICHRACRSFPLSHVINFENRGSSYYSGKPGYLDVCLTRSQIESIIIDRGGHELLHSDVRFRYLLGRGSRHEIRSDEGVPLYIAEFHIEQMEELKGISSKVDVKSIGSQDLVAAIMRSFVECNNDPTPPIERCFLGEDNFLFFRHDLGLAIDEEDFYHPTAASLEYLPQISKGMSSDNDAIQEECTNFLRDILLADMKSPIIQIVDFGFVPKLVRYLQHHTRPMNAIDALTAIAKETRAEVQVAFETARLLPIMISQLETLTGEELKTSALEALAAISLNVSDAHAASAFEEADPIPKLIRLIEGDGSETVQSKSVAALGAVSEKVTEVQAANAVSQLVRLQLEKSVANLAEIALGYFMWKLPAFEAADHIPILIRIMKTDESESVKVSALDALVHLSKTITDAHAADAVTKLFELLDSEKSVAHLAAIAIGHFSWKSPACRENIIHSEAISDLLVKAANSGDPEVFQSNWGMALRASGHVAENCNYHRMRAVLDAAGPLPTLLSSRESSAEEEDTALSALVEMAKSIPVAHATAATPILARLVKSKTPIAHLAAFALGCFSLKAPELLESIIHSIRINALVQAAKSSDNPGASKTNLSLVRSFLKPGQIIRQSVFAGVRSNLPVEHFLQPLHRILLDDKGRDLKHIVLTLACLYDSSFVTVDSGPSVALSTLDISGDAKTIITAQVTRLWMLVNRTDPKLQQLALYAVKIAMGHFNLVQLLIDCNAVPTVIARIKSFRGLIKVYACDIMRQILTDGTKSQVDAFVSQGCVPVLCHAAQKHYVGCSSAMEALSLLLSSQRELCDGDKTAIESICECASLKQSLRGTRHSNESEDELSKIMPHFEKVVSLCKQAH